uniref:Uncharacterized protein n=1 Tax=Cyclopterus lumpus TaxID=8103 RepID=A0A8C3B260_CYCLU
AFLCCCYLPSQCSSSDRQLSLDLVNVGRQRLDFLPMLEHSGTYRESSTHTGTFAQEIITLVHLVKEQYFRGGGVTLSQRFSTPQKDVYAEDESEELTLDERFSANRYVSFFKNRTTEQRRLLSFHFHRLPVRGPGDLRHDLERRRQERLEGVKVTISGSSVSQRPLGPSRWDFTLFFFLFFLEISVSQATNGILPLQIMTCFISEINVRIPPARVKHRLYYRNNKGPRRGAPYAAPRRNTRPVSRLGPMRNNRSSAAGSRPLPAHQL